MPDRKREIVEAAADLLQSRSFSSFSYQDISDILEIRKASIHHHFRPKEDLGIALAEYYREWYKARLDEITKLYDQPWDRLEAYLALASDIMLSGGKICPAGAFQPEHNLLPERVRTGINGMMQYVRGWLAGVLTKGRSVGTIEFQGKPEAQAALIMAALQGSLQNARSEGPQLYRAVVGQIRAGMKPRTRSATPPRSSPPSGG